MINVSKKRLSGRFLVVLSKESLQKDFLFFHSFRIIMKLRYNLNVPFDPWQFQILLENATKKVLTI